LQQQKLLLKGLINMLRRILSLIYKEFLAVWRDKRSRFVLIAPPIIQLVVFAYAATLDVKNVSIGILNLDQGEKGFQLSELFYHSTTFKKITNLSSFSELRGYIDNEKGVVALVIPQQFTKELKEGKETSLETVLNGRKSNTAQIVQGYISRVVSQFILEQTPNSTSYKIELRDRNWFNPNLIYNWFTIPGLLSILLMLESLIIVALSLAREKELGNFDQLLVSPLEPIEILIGKIIPAIVISMIEGSVIVLVSQLFFKIPFVGSYFLLAISMLIYIFSVIGFALFLSALCTTQQQAVLIVFVFMTPSILLSGFASPIENMPNWLQLITYMNPARYFLKICRGLFMKGIHGVAVLKQIAPMILIAFITLSSALTFLRKKLS
jgi:ABC-2 type transport system permease protein